MSFWRHQAGSSVVEFAAVLPVCLVLLLGGMEVGQELMAARKTVRVARVAADLTSQVAQVSTSGISTLMNAATLAAIPLSASALGIVVSEISTDAQGKATVVWSQARNAQPLTVGSTITIPAGVSPGGTSMILGQALYAYTPSFGSAFIPARTLTSQIFMSPRVSATVDLQP